MFEIQNNIFELINVVIFDEIDKRHRITNKKLKF